MSLIDPAPGALLSATFSSTSPDLDAEIAEFEAALAKLQAEVQGELVLASFRGEGQGTIHVIPVRFGKPLGEGAELLKSLENSGFEVSATGDAPATSALTAGDKPTPGGGLLGFLKETEK